MRNALIITLSTQISESIGAAWSPSSPGDPPNQLIVNSKIYRTTSRRAAVNFKADVHKGSNFIPVLL